MIKTKDKLSVFHDDNGTFADYSNEAVSYDRDSFGFTLVSTEDYLYIGFYKPISAVYVEMETASSTDTTLSAEYFNGAWVTLDAHDDTRAFQRSGFIKWDRNQDSEEKTSVDGVEDFWYRFKPASDTSAISIKGLNIVFADDQDLKREFFEIDKWLPSGEASHILTHVASRDEIIQQIRNDGKRKHNNGVYKDITPFDILDTDQVNKGAIYLALSKIFATITDDPDDTYRQKSLHYRQLFDGAMNLFYLDIDADDDGVTDDTERMQVQHSYMVRR